MSLGPRQIRAKSVGSRFANEETRVASRMTQIRTNCGHLHRPHPGNRRAPRVRPRRGNPLVSRPEQPARRDDRPHRPIWHACARCNVNARVEMPVRGKRPAISGCSSAIRGAATAGTSPTCRADRPAARSDSGRRRMVAGSVPNPWMKPSLWILMGDLERLERLLAQGGGNLRTAPAAAHRTPH